MDEPPPTPPPPDRPLPEPPQPGLFADPGFRQPPRFPMKAAENRNEGWLVLVGGVLVIGGVLLPWLTLTGPATASVKGSELAGWGFYILGGFAIVRGLSMARPDRFTFRLGTPLIGGVILALLVASNWSRLQDDLDLGRARGFEASIGVGFWIVVAGTACVLIGGVLGMRRRA